VRLGASFSEGYLVASVRLTADPAVERANALTVVVALARTLSTQARLRLVHLYEMDGGPSRRG